MTKNTHTVSKQELRRIKGKTLLKAGHSIKKVTKEAGISRKTVSRLKTRGTPRKLGSGKPQSLGRKEKLRIYNFAKNNPYYTCQDLVDKYHLPCSQETVRRYLHKAGFRYRKTPGKEALTKEDMDYRAEWCVKYLKFPFSDHLTFTDEAGFWLKDDSERGWFHKDFNQRVTESNFSGKLNVWMAVSVYGKIAIHIFTENFDKFTYRNILKEVLIPKSKAFFPYGFYLQCDNHAVHRSDLIINYLNNEASNVVMDTIDWPARSPDLNPVENLWHILKHNVRKRKPRTLLQLEKGIREAWEALDDNLVQRLCEGFRLRLFSCLFQAGKRLKY